MAQMVCAFHRGYYSSAILKAPYGSRNVRGNFGASAGRTLILRTMVRKLVQNSAYGVASATNLKSLWLTEPDLFVLRGLRR